MDHFEKEWRGPAPNANVIQDYGGSIGGMTPGLSPELSFGYQVRRCHRRFDRLLSLFLSRHGLKTGYWYYLRILWLGDGVSQKYLSDQTNVTENTTVAMIDGMVRHGYVTRTRDKIDRRKQLINLTERGSALEAELMQYAVSINEVAIAGIATEELDICRSVLRRMSENLAVEFRDVTEASTTE